MLKRFKGTPYYKGLFHKYTKGDAITVEEQCKLFQFILDTDQHKISDKIERTAEYMLAEGFLYYVHTGD